MKIIEVRADKIERGNIIEEGGEVCHVLRVKSDGYSWSELLLQPFGCIHQSTLRYSSAWCGQTFKRYVASKISNDNR